MHNDSSAIQDCCDKDAASDIKEIPVESNIEKPDSASKVLEWRCHLLTIAPLKGLIPIAVTLTCCICAWFIFNEWWWVGLTALILFLSMLRFYFPIYYKLDEMGVTTFFLGIRKLRPWSDFKNIYKQKNGVFLAPFEKPSRLDAFRGLVINCVNNNNEVTEFIKERLNIA